MSLPAALPHKRPVPFHSAGGYTLLETLVAFVVLIVFLVLAYSFVFRDPASLSALKPQSAEQSGIPEVKPGSAKSPAPLEKTDAPAGKSPSSPAGR